MSPQEKHNYYLKAYAAWWVTMAFLGSLFLNGPSKTFIGAAYNSTAWSAAALLALLIATLQTHYRGQLKRLMNHPLMVKLGALLFWGMQCLNSWGRYQKKPEAMWVFMLIISSIFTFCVFASFVTTLYRTVCKPKEETVPVAPSP